MKKIILAVFIIFLTAGCSSVDKPSGNSMSIFYNGYIKSGNYKSVSGTASFFLGTEQNSFSSVYLITPSKAYKMAKGPAVSDKDIYVITIKDKISSYYFQVFKGGYSFYIGQSDLSSTEIPASIKTAETSDFSSGIDLGGPAYYINIDRFNNGDVLNDPLFTGFGPEYFVKPNTFKSSTELPWNLSQRVYSSFAVTKFESDFNLPTEFEKEVFKDKKPVLGLYRSYGGDIPGIINKLDYIKGLGFKSVMLSPPFLSYSFDKKAFLDIGHIDPVFGSHKDDYFDEYGMLLNSKHPEQDISQNTETDKFFFDFVAKTHAKGMKVILDFPLFYCSADSPFFKDVLINGRYSGYYNWFKIKDTELMTYISPDEFKEFTLKKEPDKLKNSFIFSKDKVSEMDSFSYREFNKLHLQYETYNNNPELPMLNLSNESVRKYIYDSLKKWVSPESPASGIDGIRIMTSESSVSFINDLTKYTKTLNPNFVVYEDNPDYSEYPLAKTGSTVPVNKLISSAVRNFIIKDSGLNAFFDSYVPGNIGIDHGKVINSINVLDAPEFDRFISNTINRSGTSDTANSPYESQGYLSINPALANKNALYQLKAALAVLYFLPGNPMVLYGTESSMWGGDFPYSLKPMIWEEIKYAKETDRFDYYKSILQNLGKEAVIDEVNGVISYDVKPEKEITEFIKTLNKLRVEMGELASNGNIKFSKYGTETLVIERMLNNREYIAVINNFDKAEQLSFTPSVINTYTDILDGKSYSCDNNMLKIDVPGKSFILLKR